MRGERSQDASLRNSIQFDMMQLQCNNNQTNILVGVEFADERNTLAACEE